MNDLLKNPVLLFLAGLLALWLAFRLVKVFLSMFWIIVILFIFFFAFNERFRNGVRIFFSSLFGN